MQTLEQFLATTPLRIIFSQLHYSLTLADCRSEGITDNIEGFRLPDNSDFLFLTYHVASGNNQYIENIFVSRADSRLDTIVRGVLVTFNVPTERTECSPTVRRDLGTEICYPVLEHFVGQYHAMSTQPAQ